MDSISVDNKPTYYIVSYNGLALNRRQTVIWTNDGLVYWRIYASLKQIELRYPKVIGPITFFASNCEWKFNNVCN